jgi:hypothetical protein
MHLISFPLVNPVKNENRYSGGGLVKVDYVLEQLNKKKENSKYGNGL